MSGAADPVRVERLSLSPETSPQTVKGVVRGYDVARYAVYVSHEGTLSVSFQPSNRSCYFTIKLPGTKTPVVDSSITGDNRFQGAVPAAGETELNVYLYRNAARRREVCRYVLGLAVR